MNLHEITRIALEAGEILLRSGAETYRVEESMIRICQCYGLSCETFVLPTGIFLTVYSSSLDAETFVRRITVRTLNMDRIDRINSFSRRLAENPLSYEEAIKHLKDIRNSGFYPLPLQFLSAAVMAFSFAILFGGNVLDGSIALIIGSVAYTVSLFMLKSGYFPFLIYFAVGFTCGLLSLLSEMLFWGSNAFIIIISSILLYLPGVSMTNGVRDLLGGDTVSGLTRLGEAVLTVTAIGMGVGLAFSIPYFGFITAWRVL